MLNKFDSWQYRDDRNCWDFVREFLIDVGGVPAECLPKYGIAPSDKKSMTEAAQSIESGFVDSEPVDFAIACHYIGNTIIHVGVVYNGYVLHTGAKHGTKKNTIKAFERLCQKTVYRLHGSLKRI
jgi:hypothetical protein